MRVLKKVLLGKVKVSDIHLVASASLLILVLEQLFIVFNQKFRLGMVSNFDLFLLVVFALLLIYQIYGYFRYYRFYQYPLKDLYLLEGPFPVALAITILVLSLLVLIKNSERFWIVWHSF
ncbi:MAG: hypothetical protein ABGX24_03035 [Aquificota bacterium]|jgi:hypothetical protein